MKVQLLNDKVLIQRDAPAKMTAGGLHLPLQAIEKSDRGTVVGVGPGKILNNGVLKEMAVKEGDVVLLTGVRNIPVTIEGIDYLIVREPDILAIERS